MEWKRVSGSAVVLVAALSIVGCSETRTAPPEASTPTADKAEVAVSDEVMRLLRDNNTVTAAVKLHQKETGLPLAEAKEQVEAVAERNGFVRGGDE